MHKRMKNVEGKLLQISASSRARCLMHFAKAKCTWNSNSKWMKIALVLLLALGLACALLLAG